VARVLVVDDDSNIRRYFAQELSGEGYEVSTVAAGKQLLSIIDVFKPDVLVLDIRLEDYNGLELLKEIRKKRYALPVILCSAYKEYKYDQRSVGADYYVVKSVDLSELKSAINEAVKTIKADHLNGD
jgi:DNA-binding response OmpR family regulator